LRQRKKIQTLSLRRRSAKPSQRRLRKNFGLFLALTLFAALLVGCAVREDAVLEKIGTWNLSSVWDDKASALPLLSDYGSAFAALKARQGVLFYADGDNVNVITNAAFKEVDYLLVHKERVLLTSLSTSPLTLKWSEWLSREKKIQLLANWQDSKIDTNEPPANAEVQILEQIVNRRNAVVTLLSDYSVLVLERDQKLSRYTLPAEWAQLTNSGNFFLKKIFLSPYENEIVIYESQVSKRGVEGVRFKKADYVKNKILSQVAYDMNDVYFLGYQGDELTFVSPADRDLAVRLENYSLSSKRKLSVKQLSFSGRKIGAFHYSGSELHGYTLDGTSLTLWYLK
jgi:hypothetical protein